MTLRLFNTLTRSIEEFSPIEPGRVRMYNCGPTVYNYQHIGNYRTYMFADTLRRYLEYRGYQVTQIINITDVGHLTEDDIGEGDDKIQVMARKMGWDPFKVARHFEDAYLADRRLLGFLEPAKFPRATEHIPEMIAWIEKLVEKGVAYAVGANVYYDISKFPDYGKLSGNLREEVLAGARVEVNPEKRNPEDFALWKHDPKHLMQWDSPWGRGFPGWHIECSAMSAKYLGESFDIHTGGEDNIFPHHECEIAQTEAVTGKRFVRTWVHARHLLWEGRKMSKRDGTFFKPQDLLDKGFTPMGIRLALGNTRYRERVSFSMKLFEDAEIQVKRLVELKRRLESSKPGGSDPAPIAERARKGFEAAMDDDLNVSGALAAIHDFTRDVNRELDRGGLSDPKAALDALLRFDSVFGILRDSAEEKPPEEVVRLAGERLDARKRKDFAAADAIRDKIRELGWTVEDTKEGPKFKRTT